MARIVLLCSLVLLALLYLGIWFGAYKYLKNKKVDGVSLLDSAVNESKDTSKIPLNELIVYFLMIAIAVSGAIKLMHGAGSGFSIMARWIIGPPALALFNARKRTGRSLMVLWFQAETLGKRTPKGYIKKHLEAIQKQRKH